MVGVKGFVESHAEVWRVLVRPNDAKCPKSKSTRDCDG
jgi:hypothetical protein